MKYLGIDYGTKKIGLALSDDDGRVAFPHSVIKAGPQALSEIHSLITERGVGEIILGESRDYTGEKNAVMEDIEQFKRDLEELTSLPVHFEQELLTSAQAARQFAPEEGSRKQNPSQDMLDAAAAALILQSFLDKMNK